MALRPSQFTNIYHSSTLKWDKKYIQEGGQSIIRQFESQIVKQKNLKDMKNEMMKRQV